MYLVLLLHPFNSLFSTTTWVSRCQKGKTSPDLSKARVDRGLGCSGISWTICKQSAPHSRQITTPTPHHSIFYRPDALPDAQPTVSKHWRHYSFKMWHEMNSGGRTSSGIWHPQLLTTVRKTNACFCSVTAFRPLFCSWRLSTRIPWNSALQQPDLSSTENWLSFIALPLTCRCTTFTTSITTAAVVLILDPFNDLFSRCSSELVVVTAIFWHKAKERELRPRPQSITTTTTTTSA